ncbi:MAG: cytochrome c5 [Lentimonas sp.]|jgi:cytochrome c5
MKTRLGSGAAQLALLLLFTLTTLLVGCGRDTGVATLVAPEPSAVFDPMALLISDANLIKGREIWVPLCGQCHITGLGGAPKIGNTQDWGPRIAKGPATLYDHAINGFSGPLYHEMPAKGGFMHLSDDEVKLAVDFVVFASQSK